MKKTSKISHQASRLKKIRLYLGMTREQFGSAIHISQFTLRSWENGAKNFTDEGVERVITSLKNKLKFSCSFDWLMYGSGSSPIALCEDNYLIQNSAVNIKPSQDRLLDEIVMFKKLNPEVNVTVVSDEKFYPLADMGDYVGLLPIVISKMDSYLDKIVLAMLKDDSSAFGMLAKEKMKKTFLWRVNSLVDSEFKSISLNRISQIYHLVWLRKNI